MFTPKLTLSIPQENEKIYQAYYYAGPGLRKLLTFTNHNP